VVKIIQVRSATYDTYSSLLSQIVEISQIFSLHGENTGKRLLIAELLLLFG